MIIRSVMIYILYFYIFTLPLLSEKAFSGRSGDVLLLVVFLVYILGVLINMDMRGRFINGIKNFYKDILGLSIIILFISMSISAFYAYDKNIAITESLRFLSYIILYFIIKYEIIDENTKVNILKLYISISAILSIMGIIQYFTLIGLDKTLINGWVRRIPVTLSNPNNYGAYLILAIFPVLMLTFKEKRLFKKIIYSVIFLMLLFNVLLTYSRNAWLGFGLGCLVLAFIFSKKLIAILGGIGIIGLFVPKVSSRLSQAFDISQNMDRINLWKLSLLMIKDHPILGIGNGNYVSMYDMYSTKYPLLRHGKWRSYTIHNSYLKIQTELGIAGSLSFLGILVSAWLNVRRAVSKLDNEFIKTFYIGYLASMAAFYFMNIFDNLFFVPKTTTYFWILLAVSQSFLYNKNTAYVHVDLLGGQYEK